MLTAMSPSAVDLDHARSLVDGGSRGAAVTLLRRSLSGRNPYLEPVDAEIRDLTEFYLGLAADGPAETDAIGWLLYLHRAELRPYRPQGRVLKGCVQEEKPDHTGKKAFHGAPTFQEDM